MKKLLILLVLMVPIAVLQAQLEKGSVMIGTTTDIAGTSVSFLTSAPNSVGVAFLSTKSKSDNHESETQKTTILNIKPNVGFFVADDFLIGAEVTFEYLKYKGDDEAITIFGFGPFVRYYFPLEKVSPFVQVSANFGQFSYGSDDKMGVLEYGGAVGAAFFIGDKVSLDLFLGYNHNEFKEKDSSDNYKDIFNVFGFGVGLSVFL